MKKIKDLEEYEIEASELISTFPKLYGKIESVSWDYDNRVIKIIIEK